MSRSIGRPARSGFKLIGLIVALVAISTLAAVGIVVIGNAREKGRQLSCHCRLINVSQATNAYELTQRQYPGYSNVLRLSDGRLFVDPQTGQKHGVSYVIPILPHLDQPLLDQAWKTPTGQPAHEAVSAKPGLARLDTKLSILVCPLVEAERSDSAPLNYVANCGMADGPGESAGKTGLGQPRDWQENGVFFDLFTGNPRLRADFDSDRNDGDPGPPHTPVPDAVEASTRTIPLVWMSSEYINRHDGVGQTWMLGENVDAGRYTDYTEARLGMLWAPDGTVDTGSKPPHLEPPNKNMRINVGTGKSRLSGSDEQPGTTFARPSSFHPGGVNMAFCDGKVRFVSDSMDYYVYCLLMSTDGVNVKRPGSSQVLPGFDHSIAESWYLGR